MDNDAKILQKARDLYKGLRFGWRYRGVELMDAEAGNDYIAQCIRWGRPFCAGRCGATEMRCMAEYLKNQTEESEHFSPKIRAEMRDLSGMFPTDDATLERFCKLYAEAAHAADLLALWDVGAEREVIKGCGPETRFAKLRALEPYYHASPWSAALAGKRVLVVHPFADTIRSQYARREQLFQNPDVLPEFASLRVVKAVQGLGGQETGYHSWFDALAAMEEEIAKEPFDVAVIGAGAYGLPLAAFCARELNAQAVQMAGATQLLFGIRGKRWDDHPILSRLYNDAWVRPGDGEGIRNKDAVEGGSYW
ncbi:MAG TPA: hypothetical protein H9860_09070 [Candidatus Gemmiger faecavium]|nr:hypothetical protein [Candidatus Gemmiger faecavium]